MAKINLNNIYKSFDDVKVIKNISIDIKDGEFMSFLGPSGCGKTTMLRMLAGFEMPTQGDIYIGDNLVSSVENNIFIPPEKRNISMVFQNYAVWPHMNVYDNVAYPLKIQKYNKKAIRKNVQKALHLVQMSDLEKRYPNQLSGGQQQRVALARALILEPDVMLLDEPLSNLDAKLREEMRFEIKEIHNKLNLTIIYVTHDQTEAMAMSDRIMLLDKGIIQQIGKPNDIYEKPENKFVADFIGLVNFLEAKYIKETNENNDIIRIYDGMRNYDITCDKDIMENQEITLVVRPENIKLLSPEEAKITSYISKKVYLGNIIDYRIKINDKVVRIETSSDVQYEVGDQVGIKLTRYAFLNN